MQLPHHFGKYVLIKKIANGGMAEIYKAKYFGERGFAKDVAVKRVLPVWSERKEFETMLIDEAKALVHLQHQNIVQVHELGRDGDYFYISMEYVNGVDLRKLWKRLECAQDALSEKYACFIIMEVLKGLEFAHRQKGDDGGYLNIVHRDISPQNIMLSFNGEVKLTDFGIAKGLHRDQETTTSQLKGKYAYMSPEQALGENIDSRSDIYSVGIVLYEIITGRRLFSGGTDFDTIQRIRKSMPFDGWDALVNLSLRKILCKALSAGRDDRFQTAAEFLRDLDNYVALKKMHTHSLEFSDHLNLIFLGEKDEEELLECVAEKKTKVLCSIAKKKKSVKRQVAQRRYAAVVCLLLTLFVGASFAEENGGDGLRLRDVAEKKLFPLPEKLGVVKKPFFAVLGAISTDNFQKGIIKIDSKPSNTRGKLLMGGVERDFITPFSLTDISLKEDLEGRIFIENGEGKAIEEEFKLSLERPVFSKTYISKPDGPGFISIQARPWGYVYVPGVVNGVESPVRSVKVRPGKHRIKVHYAPTNSWARADIHVNAGKSHSCYADFSSGEKMYCR